MKDLNTQKARPGVVLAIMAIPLAAIILFWLVYVRKPSRLVESPPIAVYEPATKPARHENVVSFTTQAEEGEATSKNEAELNKFGLSVKNPIRLSLKAQARPPIVLPNQLVKTVQ